MRLWGIHLRKKPIIECRRFCSCHVTRQIPSLYALLSISYISVQYVKLANRLTGGNCPGSSLPDPKLHMQFNGETWL